MKQLPGMDLIIQALARHKSAAIFLPENPSFDVIAASLSLFLSLQEKHKERFLSIVCSSPMTVQFSQLVGVNKISTKISGRNLIVSFDYLENAIDKVSYNIENKKFNLVIQPKSGFASLSSENVNYSYSGDIDLAVVVGAQTLGNLGSVYASEQDLFKKSEILNIDIKSENVRFGKMNAVFSEASSYCEIVASILKEANYPVSPDVATNLLLGIRWATDNFSLSKAGALAFEAVGFCLRSGARYQLVSLPGRQSLPSKPFVSQGKADPLSLTAMPKSVSAIRSPQENNPDGKTPAPDWYGPKIFRGSKRV